MLNIAKKSIINQLPLEDYQSGKLIFNKSYYHVFNRMLLIFLIGLLVILFLPWTQTINGKGYVTALEPDQRPQMIQSPIPGRIESWYVNEGDYVEAGDTIIHISEVKSEYFDEDIVARTGDQIDAKKASIVAYSAKIKALNDRIMALEEEQNFKLEQAKNKLQQAKLKVSTDRMNLEAADVNVEVAQSQYDRIVHLQTEGLKATRDVEDKRMKLQSSRAKFQASENKLVDSQNEVANAELELSRLEASYADKIAKSRSDLYTAQSDQMSTKAEVSKLETAYANYDRRQNLYFVTAPQNGYVNKTLKTGVGETFKAGEDLLNITPADYTLAVETYVRPIDLPLLHIGERARVQFDGWPAIVFSGWESASYGTYGAKVVAIDNFISPNGMYRVLMAPDEEDYAWPELLRMGSGVKTLSLLNDVPIWYELWRQINGFPPNYYKPKDGGNESKKKFPIKVK